MTKEAPARDNRLPPILWGFLIALVVILYGANATTDEPAAFLTGFLALFSAVFAFGLWLVRGEATHLVWLYVGLGSLIAAAGFVLLFREAPETGDQMAIVVAGAGLLVTVILEYAPARNPRTRP